MRTKILLAAAAAMAAGVVASNAQVYSQNVVGYVNQVCPASPNFVMLANPLTTGNDVITNVIQGAPGGTLLLVWNGAGFDSYTYVKKSSQWQDVNNNNVNNNPLPVGTGFFVRAATSFTNTFVGSVVASSGGSVTNALSTSINAVGSLIPYSGSVTNASALNLQVAGGTLINLWDPATQQFNSYTYVKKAGTWEDVNNNPVDPTLSVGEGFFIRSATATNWVETLQ